MSMRGMNNLSDKEPFLSLWQGRAKRQLKFNSKYTVYHLKCKSGKSFLGEGRLSNWVSERHQYGSPCWRTTRTLTSWTEKPSPWNRPQPAPVILDWVMRRALGSGDTAPHLGSPCSSQLCELEQSPPPSPRLYSLICKTGFTPTQILHC